MDISSIIPIAEHLTVTVISPQQILFSGEAKSISSKNSVGNFDLIPEHANFITIIENYPITIRTNKNQKLDFNFPLSIIYITNNIVKIYAQLPTPEIE